MVDDLDYRKAELHKPTSRTVIILTLLLALFFNALPWQGIGLILRPDALAVMLLYWSMNRPSYIGMGVAWIAGLLADVGDASVLGQHALAYTIMAYGGLLLHRRLHMFHLHQQVPQIFGLFFLSYAIYAFTHWQINQITMWWYFLGCFTSTLMWALVNVLAQYLKQRRADRDNA